MTNWLRNPFSRSVKGPFESVDRAWAQAEHDARKIQQAGHEVHSIIVDKRPDGRWDSAVRWTRT